MTAQVDATFLRRCLGTLEYALTAVQRRDPDDIAYDVFRAACVKEFELVLEQSGKLLKKRLKPYFASSRQVDRLMFKGLALLPGFLADARDLADRIEGSPRD